MNFQEAEEVFFLCYYFHLDMQTIRNLSSIERKMLLNLFS